MAKTVADRFKELVPKAFLNDQGVLKANGFIKNEIKTDSDLLECLWDFALAFIEGRPNWQRPTKERALMVCYSLFKKSVVLADQLNGLGELVPRMIRIAKGETGPDITALHLPLAEPWQELSEKDRKELDLLSKQKLKELAKAQTLITPLIREYVRKHSRGPTAEELLEFDPVENAELRKAYDTRLAECEKIWNQFKLKGPVVPKEDALKQLDSAFARFEEFLQTKASDPLSIFQVLSWVREISSYRRESSDNKPRQVSVASAVWQELYLEVCHFAVRKGAPKLHTILEARDVPAQDLAFFLAPYRRHPNDGRKLALRLKHGLTNVPQFRALQTARRRDDRWAAYAGIQLLDELEITKLQNEIQRDKKAKPGEVSERVVRVLSHHAAFTDKYKIGQAVLEDFTIVWIEKDDRRSWNVVDDKVIVEFHGRECSLFRTNAAGLETLVKNAFHKMLARNAAALTQFLLAYLEVVGLMVDVITAGASGGFRRILFQLVKEKAKEKAVDKALDKLGVEHPVVRAVAGMGVNLVRVPAPKAAGLKAKPDQDFNPVTQRADAISKGPTLDRGVTQGRALDDPVKPVTKTPDAPPPTPAPAVPKKKNATADDITWSKKPANDSEIDIPEQGFHSLDRQRQLNRSKEEAKTLKQQEALEQPKQMEMARASNDRGGGGVIVGRAEPDAKPSTGGGSVSGGSPGRPKSKQRGTPETIPDPAIPTRGISGTPKNELDEVAGFFTQNRASYPKNIREMIDNLPKPGTRAVSRAELERIDKAIRQVHTNKANMLMGHRPGPDAPFVLSSRSTANEGGMFAMHTTDGKQLSLHGQLKSGSGTVEFDAVNFRGRNITETKMNLFRKSDREIYDQMYRQVTFAQDWKFGKVTWEVWDTTDMIRASAIRKRVLRDYPHLEGRFPPPRDPGASH